MSMFTRVTASLSNAATSAKDSVSNISVSGVLRTAAGLIAGGIVAFVGFHLIAFLLAVAAWVIAALAALALAVGSYYLVSSGNAMAALGAMRTAKAMFSAAAEDRAHDADMAARVNAAEAAAV